MNLTSEQLTKAKAAKSVEELLALAKENGMELTEEEAAKHFAEWHKEGEIADEELDNVAGGCGDPHEKHQSWNEQSYPTDQPDVCPVCGKLLTFVDWYSRTSKIYHCPVGDVDFRVDWFGEYHRYFYTRI